MSIPKEPRQQMINMMYLVLTALLALNVSAEVLNAFKLVSDGMTASNNAMDSKNAFVMNALEQSMQNDKKKTEKYYNDAIVAQRMVDEFVEYVGGLRAKLIEQSGGYLEEGDTTSGLKGKKDYDTPTRLMVDQKEGDELQRRIAVLRDSLLTLPSLDDQDKTALDDQMTLTSDFEPMKDAAKKLGKDTWSEYLFDHVPVIAVNTILTKIQGDAKNSETLILDRLLGKIGAKDYKFDALNSQVIAKSSYVLVGSEYKADIFVGASSSTQVPEVYVGKFKPGSGARQEDGSITTVKLTENPLQEGYDTLPVDGSIGKLTEKATKVGIVQKEGVIRVKQPTGTGYDYYPFELEYQSAQSSVVVSPTKMNVLYIGVDNPMAVSVAGFPANRVMASIGQGTISKDSKAEGGYVARVKQVGDTKINVSCRLDDGSVKAMGSVDFRVKRIPDPIAKVAGQAGGNIKASTFKVQRGVLAVLENFDFDVRYNITGFELTYAAKRQDLVTDNATSAVFTGKMLDWMNRAKPGDVFYFDNVKAKGPDGTTRKLPSIAFKLI